MEIARFSYWMLNFLHSEYIVCEMGGVVMALLDSLVEDEKRILMGKLVTFGSFYLVQN